MNKTKLVFILTILFSLFTMIENAYATDNSENIDFLHIPNALAERLGISLFAAQMILSAIILFIAEIAILFACAEFERPNYYPSIIVGYTTLGTLIALGWLSYWFLLVIALISVGVFSSNVKEWFT